MEFNELPDNIRLAAEMMRFSIWSSKKTGDMRAGEVKQALSVFFTTDEIRLAQEFRSEAK